MSATNGTHAGPKHHLLSVLVENKAGVLARVASLFARRGYNIYSLAVAPTDDERLSRITIVADAESAPLEQVVKQLHKLINVLKIRDLEPADTVARQLALFKVAVDGAQRAEVLQLCEIFRGKVVDVTRKSLIIELTGSRSEVVRRPLPSDDPKQRRPDITRARTLFGFEPKVSLHDGLLRTIEDFRGRLADAPRREPLS